MKRFFTLILAVSVCLSLCVSVAFADVTLVANDKVPVGFPFFISGSNVVSTKFFSGADLVDTTVSATNKTITNITGTYNGITLGYDSSTSSYSYQGTANSTFNTYASKCPVVPNHIYFFDTWSTGENNGFYYGGQNYYSYIFNSAGSGSFGFYYQFVNGRSYDFSVQFLSIDLTEVFGAGMEPSTVDEARSALSKMFGSYEFFTGTKTIVAKEVSYQPSTVYFDNEYSLINISDGDVQGGINQQLNQVVFSESYTEEGDYLSTESYNLTSVVDNGNGTYTISGTLDGASYSVPKYQYDFTLADIRPQSYPSGSYTLDGWLVPSTYGGAGYTVNPDLTFNNVTVSATNGDSSGTITGTSSEDGSLEVTGTGTITGSGSIGGSVNFGTLKLKKNKINFSDNNLMSGAYSADLVLSFGSQADYDSFNGGFYFNFETPAYNFSVPVKAQLLGANDSDLTKFYKIDVNNSYTGTYTKWTLGVYGAPSVINWISDVINYDTLYHVDTLDGLAKAEHSFFSDLWAKIKGLFNDRDKAMADSVSEEAVQTADQIGNNAESIHEYETATFDNADTYSAEIDWNVPSNFGSASETSSTVGFVASMFLSMYDSLPTNIQFIITVPLILGLVMLILGRGSQALGAIQRVSRAPRKKGDG